MKAVRPAVGPQLVGVDPALKLLRPAAPEERRLAPVVREAAVEEHRKPQFGADAVCEGERGAPRVLLGSRFERDERDDVGGSDPRVGALVLAQIDPLDRGRDPTEQRLDQLLSGADEREDRAMVIPVDVDVQQPRGCGESIAERLERRLVAPVRDVGDRFEGQRHRWSLRKRIGTRNVPDYTRR
jgi:hypothetical protein